MQSHSFKCLNATFKKKKVFHDCYIVNGKHTPDLELKVHSWHLGQPPPDRAHYVITAGLAIEGSRLALITLSSVCQPFQETKHFIKECSQRNLTQIENTSQGFVFFTPFEAAIEIEHAQIFLSVG